MSASKYLTAVPRYKAVHTLLDLHESALEKFSCKEQIKVEEFPPVSGSFIPGSSLATGYRFQELGILSPRLEMIMWARIYINDRFSIIKSCAPTERLRTTGALPAGIKRKCELSTKLTKAW